MAHTLLPALLRRISYPAMYKRLLLLFLLACLCLPLHLASQVWAQNESDVLCITDDTGTHICLDKPATRIAPLYGAISEILQGLGKCEAIVVRTRGDELPCLENVPAAGTHLRPNLELLLGISPDLAVQMSGRKKAMLPVARLRQHGIPTAVFTVHDFADLFRVIRTLGTLTGSEKRARQLVRSMQHRLASVTRSVKDLPRPGVFFEVRYPNLLGAGRRSMVNAVVERAGGRNVLTQDKKLVRLNEEILVALNPDVYVLQRGPMNPSPVPPEQRDHFSGLKAVHKGRVLTVDERLYSRPSPRSVDAVEQLAGFLHPELGTLECLQDQDNPSAANAIGEHDAQ